MKLDELKTVTPNIATQLREIGIQSVEALVIKGMTEVKQYLQNVSEHQLTDMFIEAWRTLGFWAITADKINEVRGKSLVFSTGCKALDKILGGGIYTREISEFAGEYGVGKSQVLYTIMVEALNTFKEYSAVFLDSEDTYRDSRVREIAVARGYEPDEIAKRIIYIPIPDSEIYFEVVDRLCSTIESKNVKLILSDSLIAPLRAEYVGREQLWLRQQILNKIMRKFLNMSRVYNLAVVISNQVVTNPQALFTYDPLLQKVPTGGMIMGHNANCRVYLRKAEGSKRIARLFDSSWLPEAECVFKITEKGVEDIE